MSATKLGGFTHENSRDDLLMDKRFRKMGLIVMSFGIMSLAIGIVSNQQEFIHQLSTNLQIIRQIFFALDLFSLSIVLSSIPIFIRSYWKDSIVLVAILAFAGFGIFLRIVLAYVHFIPLTSPI